MTSLNSKQKKLLILLLRKEIWQKNELIEAVKTLYSSVWNLTTSIANLQKRKLVITDKQEYNFIKAIMLTKEGREFAYFLKLKDAEQKQNERKKILHQQELLPLQKCRQRLQVCYMHGCYHRYTCDAYALKEQEYQLSVQETV